MIDILQKMNGILWKSFLMYALLGIGILYTVYLGFPQITKIGLCFKYAFGDIFKKKKPDEKGEVNSFKALATAIAAQVGTGNIGGVATAVMAGGPGAIFWMWISGILGMSTIFAEAVLAQIYREKKKDIIVGGPAYYISKGLKSRPLAIFFAVAIILALGIVGNMVQSNSIALAMSTAFNVNEILVGVSLAIVVAFVIVGGVKRITSVAELVVPIMALVYIIGSIVILVKFGSKLPDVLKHIFTQAFSLQAVAGGAAGSVMKEAIKNGVARGLFSNEAGMGSTPHAHAIADVKDPSIQGFVAMAGVIVDTLVICSVTALIVLVSGAHGHGLDSVAVTQKAFELAFGEIGVKFLAVSLLFFAFTTIVGWYMFGEMNIIYLFGQRAVKYYRIVVLLAVVTGSYFGSDLVWELADFFNGVMVIPNMIALLFLAPKVKKTYDNFKIRRKNKEL